MLASITSFMCLADISQSSTVAIPFINSKNINSPLFAIVLSSNSVTKLSNRIRNSKCKLCISCELECSIRQLLGIPHNFLSPSHPLSHSPSPWLTLPTHATCGTFSLTAVKCFSHRRETLELLMSWQRGELPLSGIRPPS